MKLRSKDIDNESVKFVLDEEIEQYNKDTETYIVANSTFKLAIMFLLIEGKVSVSDWKKAVKEANKKIESLNDEWKMEGQNPIC